MGSLSGSAVRRKKVGLNDMLSAEQMEEMWVPVSLGERPTYLSPHRTPLDIYKFKPLLLCVFCPSQPSLN